MILPETGYPDWGIRGFPQFLQSNAMIVPSKSGHDLLVQSFSNPSFTHHPIIRRYIVLFSKKRRKINSKYINK
jgi:hypothetical protein